jgi:hypothetical protein
LFVCFAIEEQNPLSAVSCNWCDFPDSYFFLLTREREREREREKERHLEDSFVPLTRPE